MMINLAQKKELPIRVICATKGSLEDFKNSNTGRSLISSCQVTSAELKLFSSNTQGLSQVYNQAIEESLSSPALLVFVHDDVLITDFFWGSRVRNGLQLFDVVGVVGNKRRVPNQPGWIMVDMQGTLDSFSNLSGSIGQGDFFPPKIRSLAGLRSLEGHLSCLASLLECCHRGLDKPESASS
jgi:hypothetical protein